MLPHALPQGFSAAGRGVLMKPKLTRSSEPDPHVSPGTAPLLTFSDTRDATHPLGDLEKAEQEADPLETWGTGCQEAPSIPGNQGVEGREQLVERPASPPLWAPGPVWACTQAHRYRYVIGAGPGAGVSAEASASWGRSGRGGCRQVVSTHKTVPIPDSRPHQGSRPLSQERRCWRGLQGCSARVK